ncbi:MAG: hypothetical protein R3F59_16125 [Myxococcota bacterium]
MYHGDAIPAARRCCTTTSTTATSSGLFFDPVTGLPDPREVVSNTGRNFGDCAVAPDGELVLLDYNGQFFRLEPLPGQTTDVFPERLSQTGCFDATDPTLPLPALVPYDVAHPFWSDGADKRHWLALPDGEQITVGADGDWDAPVGSVLIKGSAPGGHRIETRLLMRHDDGNWGRYAYAWDEAETDATLLYGGLAGVPLTGQTWSIPDSGECSLCHNPASGGSLGLEEPAAQRAHHVRRHRAHREPAEARWRTWGCSTPT